ncbi:MAG: 6-phosphogluconolactonase [Candidatus Eisenbacteria bacterium]
MAAASTSSSRLVTRVAVAENDEQWTAWAAEEFVWSAAMAWLERGAFHVVVPGGSTPRAVLTRVAARKDVIVGRPAAPREGTGIRVSLADVWANTHVYFGDERGVGPDHPDSNFGMVRDSWLAKVSIPSSQVHRILGELALEEAARGYAALLSDTLRTAGDFDLVVLGLGPDGHTASLIPGRELDFVADSWVGVGPAPMSPALVQRVTMTGDALKRTRRMVFWAKGEEKAEVVHSALGGGGMRTIVPHVLPASGSVTWMLDARSALDLRRSRPR